mgnify:FL=1
MTGLYYLFVAATDLGGPRRQFFHDFFRQIDEQMVAEGDLVFQEHWLDQSKYYAVGLFAGTISSLPPAMA